MRTAPDENLLVAAGGKDPDIARRQDATLSHTEVTGTEIKSGTADMLAKPANLANFDHTIDSRRIFLDGDHVGSIRHHSASENTNARAGLECAFETLPSA